MRILSISVFFITTLLSCGKKVQLKKFPEQEWKDDKMACNNKRIKGAEVIRNNKKELQGINENDLVDLLGKADQTMVYSRNVKNLIYFIEPGVQCGSGTKKGRRLIFELNAIGNLTWINEEHIQ